MTAQTIILDPVDRAIVNTLQHGFPVCDRPYRAAAEGLGLSEAQLIERLRSLLERGVLTRFGPLFKPEALGGAVTLAAMEVPEGRFEEVAEILQAVPEVAHNYARTHRLNMWFVAAADSDFALHRTLEAIETLTELPVLSFPKLREFFLELKLEA